MSPARFSYRSRAWYAVPLLVIMGCQDRGLPTASRGGAAFDATPASTCEVTSAVDDGPGTLRELIADESCATIVFADALHGETIVLTTGQLVLARDVTITGPGAEQLSVSGNERSRVFFIDEGATVAISGLTITRGDADADYGDVDALATVRDMGSALRNEREALNLLSPNPSLRKGERAETGAYAQFGSRAHAFQAMLDTLRLPRSTAPRANGVFSGGGIYNSGTLTLTFVAVSRNRGDSGGGIYNIGSLVLSQSTISRNSTFEGGGGIYNSGAGRATLRHTTIADNCCGSGAGIYNEGTLAVTSSSFSDNDSYPNFGGGGAILSSGHATISHSTFSRNDAFTFGGAIWNSGIMEISHALLHRNHAGYSDGGISNGGRLTVTNSAVSENGGWFDGTGGLSNYAGGTLEITNSTIHGNRGYEGVGGITANGSVMITQSTVTNNIALGRAWMAGGILVGGTATLRNTIVADNLLQEPGLTSNCSGSISDGGYNIEDETTCGFSEANQSHPNTDPLLDPAGLQDNGGPTPTIALLPGSPAVDAIPVGTAGCGTTVTTDQRGVNRPQGPGCDIGAFELEQPPCTAVTLDRIGTDPDAPGEIRLGSPFVDAVFLDVEAFLPRSAARPLAAQADDVRWGPTWETGTPAHGFRLADETGDGQRDAVIRFETGRLVAEGNLSLETRRVTLWGSDRASGQLYCASAAVRVVP
jgi:hypothetical protein